MQIEKRRPQMGNARPVPLPLSLLAKPYIPTWGLG